MKILFAIFISAVALLEIPLAYKAKADATLPNPTPYSSANTLKIDSVCLEYTSGRINVSVSFTDASGIVRDTKTQSIPMPNPTPAPVATIMAAITKSLCGYGSGGINGITPVAVATVIP